ncbi:MAG: rhodanese-like domain-containing protein [Flavobacteriaceae bacterium]
MQEINAAQWKEKIAEDSNAVILDVRTDEEFEEGKIPSSQQLNILDPALFMEKAQKLDPTKNYYVYCRSGGRSAQACAVLQSLGIKTTYNLIGGITDWDGPIE